MWVAKNLASKDHDVTLISARGSGGVPSNLNIIETIEPSWDGMAAEETHYLMYKNMLEKEYGSGNGIVWDNTWHSFSYMSAKKFPKMKIIHINHGVVEWQKVPVTELKFPSYQGFMLNICRQSLKYLRRPKSCSFGFFSK